MSSGPPDESPVVAETRRHLEALASKHRGDPQAEVRAITLMGLEREQIVAVAYREEALAGRLEALPISDEDRAIVRRALAWIWREEEMHATFVRGVLLRSGGRLLRARAFLEQAAGALGGWATAVLHHVRFRDAPLSRLVAHALTFAGWLAGRVPRAVTRGLRHLGFREYCGFSVDAEQTAAASWHRAAALLDSAGEAELARRYAQMGRDEDHHGRVFGLLRAALRDDGAFSEGWSGAALRERLVEVGPFYVDRDHRPSRDGDPLGRGGDVVVVEGRAGEGAAALDALLERLDVDALLSERVAATGTPRGALRVAIKATFMRAYHRDDPSVTTSPELVRALVAALRARGVADVVLLESSAIYDWFYDRRDVASVARYVGLDDVGARVVDVETDLVAHPMPRGMATAVVPRAWRDADLRISFGKLGSHPIDRVYLGLSQLESLCPRADENVFVERASRRGPATMMILGALPPHLALLDAFEHVGDGLGGILASERPLSPLRLYGGRDALAVDLVACRHLGETRPEDSEHLGAALAWFGDPRGATTVVGRDDSIGGWRGACHDELSAWLSFFAHPVYVLASGRGALFVPEMDVEAFPPRTRPALALRAARHVTRWLLGARLPRPRGS